MICKICGCKNIEIIYDDRIRNGSFGNLTSKKYQMFQCAECKTIWHNVDNENYSDYYKSERYRSAVDGTGEAEHFYKIHDSEIASKLLWIGTEHLRGKSIADIGCAAGALLDYFNGVGSTIIGIEPSIAFRDAMKEKGYMVYSYVDDAVRDGVRVDLATCFDVIEHVENPVEFIQNIYNLLSDGGGRHHRDPNR